MSSALSPFFLQGSRGLIEANQGSRCHFMQSKHQHPATNLSLEIYYCVSSVQIFIIHAGGEGHRQPLHRRFLPQQSTFLPIFSAAPDSINFRLSTYLSSNTSHYMRTPLQISPKLIGGQDICGCLFTMVGFSRRGGCVISCSEISCLFIYILHQRQRSFPIFPTGF